MSFTDALSKDLMS